ncbi:MAG TPA: NTP transferase domain-containing protein [Terriglobales bacterium]|nr:NTP transferase domain-containing protein [Terriglobales bacterium]
MREGSGTSAVILAAGISTRMGEVKQLLQVDGRPLLQHVLDHVRASEISEIILVLGHAADAIRRELDLEPIKLVVNEDYRGGMGCSLKAGLSAVDPQAKAAIVVLADQPFVRPFTLDRLIREHARSGAQIVIPTYHGFRGNPVLLDRRVFPEVMGIGGDVGCRAIFGDHAEGIVKVPVEDVGILLDIDRPGDYEKLRSAEGRAQMLPLAALEVRPTSMGPAPARARPELVIVGRDTLAMTLAKLAQPMHFTVTLVDPLLNRSEVPEADRILHVLDFSLLDPSSDRHVVVASRGACDEEAIEQALRANSSYAGLVANRKRGEEVLRSLGKKGIAPQKLAGVRVPAGLAIGAGNAEEIALSILAEIVAERRKRPKADQRPGASQRSEPIIPNAPCHID